MTKGRKVLLATLIIVLALVAIGFYVWNRSPHYKSTAPPSQAQTQPAGRQAVPDFAHIVIIVEENHGLKSILNNSSAPYINKLASRYGLATNYYATFHPSLPNYLALTSGSNAGITSDCSPSHSSCLAKTASIADEIETSGRSWKAYQESMPAPCTTHNAGLYVVRHDPFVYYPKILDNQARCRQHVVPLSELATDLQNNSLPNYVFITPNVCNDMHNCSVKVGDTWLKTLVPKILNSKAFTKNNSLLAITWDEAETHDKANKVPLILVGSHVKQQYVSSQQHTHYSLLRTVEQAWGLAPLTSNDAQATTLEEFFN